MSSHIEVSRWADRFGDDVCICGIGARTAVGLSAVETAAAVRGSISGLARHPAFVDRGGEPISFAADAALAADVPVAERMLQMVQSVTAEAIGDRQAPLDCCWLALPEPREELDADLGAWLAGETGLLSLASQPVRVLSRGHAGGLMAVQGAAQMVSRGEAEIALVVGVDSYHDARTIELLDSTRRLMSPENRGGFPPGEGAGACLLARAPVADHFELPVLARVRAAATAMEPQPRQSTEPCLGLGLTAALEAVAPGPQYPHERFTAAYCDLNGERYRNEEFLYALLRSHAAFVDPHDYLSPADCWGDVGAASGPLFAVLAVVSGLRRYSKGPFPVLWAGSDSGFRSAVALSLAHN